MSRKRLLAAGGGVVLALVLGTGFSAAQTTTTAATPPAATAPTMASMHSGEHDAMHQQMRAHMPEAMQAQCDTAHAQMGAGHGMAQQSGMGSDGMMGSTTKN